MNGVPTTGHSADAVEQTLRAELAREDAAAVAARPVLRYLLEHQGNPLFSEAAIVRVRGMMQDLASQLLHAESGADERADRARYFGDRQDELAAALMADDALLAHAQALVVEADLAERLQAHGGIDAVLPPLVQELAADNDETVSALAMALLAAQARFMQQGRRMELPLRELPGDLFHTVLTILRGQGYASAETAERRLREAYDEGSSRIGLAARAVTGLGVRSRRALSIDHAGVTLFASAVALATSQERDRVMLSFAEGHLARYALTLRAAGLDPQTIEAQLLFLHADEAVPAGLDKVPVERAAMLLTSGGTDGAVN